MRFLILGAVLNALLFGISAFAADETCKFHQEYDDGDQKVVYSGWVEAKDKGDNKYELKAYWKLPEEGESELGEGQLTETDDRDLKESCQYIEETLDKKFCDQVTKITIIVTPDEGDDGNNSFIAHYLNDKGEVLGRLLKAGWYLDACRD